MVTEFRFKPGQRVRLKDQPAEVYPLAYVGSEGIVKKCEMDELGHHPMIYIEWDKDHWTYNGEKDMLTFEEHFEPVEGVESVSDRDLLESLEKFLRDYREGRSEEEEEPTEELLAEDRAEALAAIEDYLQNSEAFLVIGVTRETHPELKKPMLMADIVRFYGTDEAGLLLESQLSQFIANAHGELALKQIQEIVQESEDG
jgi:hypothetical protein